MTSRFSVLVALAIAVAQSFGAEPQLDATQLPRIPATPPEKALSTFKVKPGFRIELAAAEPIVVDPIAMCFDEDSRCYVIEMRDYSERRPERLGRIRRLEDTDGDGRFDRSTVFAQEMPWPTALACWDGGVLVGATPDIIYFKDTTGDGVADVRETIFTGFAADYAPFATNKLNVQALMNSFNWSLDNRIHGATSFSGGKVKLVGSPFVRAWLQRAGASFPAAGPLELRGRDFSFDPRTLAMRAESGGGQHGLSFDNRGRKFVCSNSSHVQTLMYEERYAALNPFSSLPRALVDIAVDGGAAPVFRISPDEPWRVIRTQWRVGGLVPGPIEGGGRPSGYFTGATGVTIYRGDAFGPEFVGDAFVGDAGGNLVHRKRILADGAGVKAVRPTDEQNVEFLASTDNWFRPVQFANAPDGCLYICDMYREVIEHPWSLPDSIKKHLDLNSGNDRGRLYRIVPEKFTQRPLPRLSKVATVELVKLLEHPNGWHRDTAARLLFERQDKSVAPALRQIAESSGSALGRVHALHALRGLGVLPLELVEAKLADPASAVRQHAVLLAEESLARTNPAASFMSKIAALARDSDPAVVLQLAFTSAQLPQAARMAAVEDILRHSTDPWLQSASLASLGDAVPALFAKLAHEDSNSAERVLPGLARLIGTRNRPDEIASVFKLLPASRESGKSLAAVVELAEGLDRAGNSLVKAAPPGQLTPYFALARDLVVRKVNPDYAALRLLAFAPYDEAAPLFSLLNSTQPKDIQTKALAALGRQTDAAFGEDLLKRWPQLSPAIRGEAIELLTKRTERIRALLAAMERGVVQPTELSAAQQSFLRSHRDPTIRDQAGTILGRANPQSRQAVVTAFLPSLPLGGVAVNGKKLFQSRCATCHKLGGEGHALGPDLATVKNAGKEKLLTNIVDPNREVNSNYLSYLVETKDGESLVGIIAGEGANSVTLRMAGGMESVVARGNIASMQSQGQSLMPEGLEAGMSSQEMADLLEFIIATP